MNDNLKKTILHAHQRGKIEMLKEEFLTVRWNNWLSLGLGLPTFIYIIFALSTTLWLQQSGLIGLSILGALF